MVDGVVDGVAGGVITLFFLLFLVFLVVVSNYKKKKLLTVNTTQNKVQEGARQIQIQMPTAAEWRIIIILRSMMDAMDEMDE
jgi:hypothetical protein